MLLSLDLVRMPLGVATAALLRLKRTSPRVRSAAFLQPLYLARLTTFPAPVPSTTSFAVLGAWRSPAELAAYRSDKPWGRGSTHASLTLDPYKSRGAWHGGDPLAGVSRNPGSGPSLVITRATTATAYHRPTWQANPAIVRSLRASDDLLWDSAFADRAFGVIGTFSLWPDEDAAVSFAYGKASAHPPVIRAAKKGSWLPESWFARATLLEVGGTWPGLDEVLRTP